MEHRKKLLTLLIILFAIVSALILIGRREEPPVPEDAILYEYKVHFPIINNTSKPKKCYSWAWYSRHNDVAKTEGISCYYRHFPISQEANRYPDMESLPMVRCDNQLDRWYRNYDESYTGYVMVLNEPLSYIQCPMSPKEGAELVKAVRESCPHCKIIAPQMEAFPWAYQWFEEFLSYNPSIDGIGIHNYSFIDSWVSPQEQLAYYEQYGLPIWVTEFGTLRPEMMDVYLELYENHPLVERIFYFAPYIPDDVTDWPVGSRLFNIDGSRTELGEKFLP